MAQPRNIAKHPFRDYSLAGMTVATQDPSTGSGQAGLQYLLTDHLGSTVAVTNSSGTLTSQQRYLPFGAVRSIPNSPILGTDFGYTGQRLLDEDMGGIMDYRARFFAPSLGRFLQPDSIVPDPSNPQDWNRYSYTRNNPIRYNDPTGHCVEPVTLIICAAIIGGAVSVAVDAYITTQINHEDYSWERAAIAFGIGALGGAIGAGIVAPVAAAVGAWAGASIAVPTALSPVVATGTELITGMFLAGSANSALSTTKRMAIAALEGEEITKDKILGDIQENYPTDMTIGAASFGIGYGAGQFVDELWQPSAQVKPLLNMHPGQQITIGAMNGGATAIGNEDLLQIIWEKYSLKKVTPIATYPQKKLPKVNME